MRVTLHALLMVGAAPNTVLEEAVEEMPDGAQVQFLVRPAVDVVHAAYSRAAALLFPSLAEGFGWPIIEAMALGCPVISSDRASMPGVCGDAAL
ncbi:MAG: glycosyltransferase, partial [Alphaproteobacteria bacterium]